MNETHSPAEIQRGRLMIVAAALLWSTSGAFTKILTKPTPLDLDQPLEGFSLGRPRLSGADRLLSHPLRVAHVRPVPAAARRAVRFAAQQPGSFCSWAFASPA